MKNWQSPAMGTTTPRSTTRSHATPVKKVRDKATAEPAKRKASGRRDVRESNARPRCPLLPIATSHQSGEDDAPIGDIYETAAQHASRHRIVVPTCARCLYNSSRTSWERSYGSHRAEPCGGKTTLTVWLAERPTRMGKSWGLGCVFCHGAMSQATSGKGGGKGRCFRACSWSRFEMRSIVQMNLRAIRQHAETDSHRLAARLYLAPLVAKTLTDDGRQGVCGSGASLFRGGVPQLLDWLRAWRACMTPVSFRAAAAIGVTTDLIHGTRQPAATSRRAFRSMVRILAFAIRARNRDALRRASSITLLLDDRGAFRLLRCKCDDRTGTDTYASGCLGVLRCVCGGGGLLEAARGHVG